MSDGVVFEKILEGDDLFASKSVFPLGSNAIASELTPKLKFPSR